ncbi:MAG: transglycosylase domain-containing protein [Nitrospiraceae bacterium]|nr:transglycosylase domain-containing protein [Nitrospiraceae bacterium]
MMKKLKVVLLAGFAALVLIVLLLAGWVLLDLRDLPDVSLLKQYRPPIASEALDRNGRPLAQFYDGKYRVWAPIAAMPPIVIQAVVIAEDDTFFGHQGVNYQAVWEALKHDVQRKRFARGGSTITQQMIKNVLLSKEKTIKRKVREYVLARRAEELLTKRRILEIYLNEVEWGDNLHGIEAASRYYFDKHVGELMPAEAALLAGMLPNPRYYNPVKRPEKALQRREQVLFNMHQAKVLSDEEYEQAKSAPLKLRDPSSRRFDFSRLESGSQPCHLRVLEQALSGIYGDAKLHRTGMTIRTTLDKTLQERIAGLSSAAASGETPESVVAVKEGTEIRALACGANEEQVRSIVNSYDPPLSNYDVVSLSVSSLDRSNILVPESSGSGSSPSDAPTSSQN